MNAIEDLIGISPEESSERLRLGKDNSDWQLSIARKLLQEDEKIGKFIKYAASIVHLIGVGVILAHCDHGPTQTGTKIPSRYNVVGKRNICLLSSRQQAVAGYRHCWVSDAPGANDCVTSTTSREANQVFPLYVYYNAEKAKQKELFDTLIWSPSKDGSIPNLSPNFVADLENNLCLKFVSDGHGDLVATFGAEDIFNYIYAIFHSPTYRQRYADFLKIDFPRVP